MLCVAVRAVGPVDESALSSLERMLSRRYAADVTRLDPVGEPADALDPKRKQYSSVAMLKRLIETAGPGEGKVLGVTERDLFIPMLTFVFGQAQLTGRFALISLARLRQEFYGLPGSQALLEERAAKEAVHELGHAFGLAHCPDASCPMSLSTTIRQVDAKGEEFCGTCASLLRGRGLIPREQWI